MNKTAVIMLLAAMLCGCRASRPSAETVTAMRSEHIDTAAIFRAERDTLHIDSITIVTATRDSLPLTVTLQGISRGRGIDQQSMRIVHTRDTVIQVVAAPSAAQPSSGLTFSFGAAAALIAAILFLPLVTAFKLRQN